MRPLSAIRTVHIDCEHRATAHAWRTLPTLEICSLGRLRTLVQCTDTQDTLRLAAHPVSQGTHTARFRAEDPERSAQGMFACNPALAAYKDS